MKSTQRGVYTKFLTCPMEEASIAVCLISSDYLSSHFILKEEVPYLLERRKKDGMVIIPILLRSCLWEAVPWLKDIQMLPADGKTVAEDYKDNCDVPFKKASERIFHIIDNPSFAPACTLTMTKWPALPADRISIDCLPVTGAELFGRQTEMELLNKAWDEGTLNAISFVAWGGVGKSTLINKWLESMKADNYRGAQRIFGWSFYSQGTGERATSADLFIGDALRWFGDTEIKNLLPRDDVQMIIEPEGKRLSELKLKGTRLADLIRREKTLLILDGLEPLQEGHDFEKGKIKDPGLSVLVNELCKDNPGLLVITTREDVAEIREAGGRAEQRNLEHITPEAGRALLRTAGVRGTDKELEDTSRAFGNHALALRLLGSYLYGEEGHKITHISKIPMLDCVSEKDGKHPRRVMVAFEKRFGEGAEIEFLRILGLLDKPAEQGAIDALLQGKTISKLTKNIRKLGMAGQKDLIAKLRVLNLIAKEGRHDQGRIDSHPFVRVHFGEQLKAAYPKVWKEANNRLYDYFQTQAPELPNTLDEMIPLFYAVVHGCAADRYKDALKEVFWRRICRGNEYYSTTKLGSIGFATACLSSFFKEPWRVIADGLTDNEKAVILGLSGFHLRALGRLVKAVEPMIAALEMLIEQKDWHNAAISAGNLSGLLTVMGEVANAVKYAEKGVDHADKSGDVFQKRVRRADYASALHQAGKIDEAERLFIEAEKMQKDDHPDFPLLYSLQGFRYCDLILEKGDYEEVLKRAKKSLELTSEQNLLLDIAFDNLSMGQAYFHKLLKEGCRDYSKAEKYLDEAVEGMRRAETQHYIPRGLLARAELYRIKSEFVKAQHDLDEAMTIATRGGMRLYESDCHLESARLCLAMGDKPKAREHLSVAKTMIDEMGYHRRDKDVEEIRQALNG